MLEAFTRLADWVAYDALALDRATKLADAVHFFVEDTTKIFFLLFVIVFVMAFFRSMLAPEKVRGYIEGRSRGVGYTLAALLGAVTPFCSCSSVPLFIGFLEAGIPVGVTMAFLITSPMVNQVAVVILASIVGWQMTAIYVAAGIGMGIVGGFAIDRFRMERYVEDYVWKIRMGELAQVEIDTTLRGRTRYAWDQATEMVRRVWLYIFIGIGIGAGLHGYVPAEFFATHAGPDNPLAVPLAVLVGLPLYSNITGIIPVAEALLHKSLPIGTVIAFMMSVVAISPPEFIILRKVLKPQMLLFFATFLSIAFVLVGYLLNALFT
ncbi:MAG TPA: permease [Candidatus Omnitrophota bacterium]|nr:permease [Candidatus Omnitrophota bacterium]